MKNNLTLLAREGKAKSLQNTGGGTSQCQTSRSKGAQQSTAQHDSARFFKYFNTQMARFLWYEKGEATVSKSSCSWAEGSVTMAETTNHHSLSIHSASIEHPLSIHSASIGARWNSRGWKYVACMLMVLFVGVGNVWGGQITYARSACSFGNNNTVYITNENDRDANISSVTITNRSNDNNSFKITGKTGSNSVITITPATNVTLTSIVINLSTAINTSNVNFYDGTTTSSTALSASTDKKVFTWSGTSTSAKAIGYINASGSSNNYGLVTSIEITYSTTSGGCTAPTITTDLSTTKVEYEQNAAATPLAIETSGTSVTYQWYSNTANSATTPTPTALENCTTKTYTPSTSTLGTTYYFCVASSSTCSTTSKITPVEVKEASGGGEDPEPTCPTSGVVYSADVASGVSSNQSVSNNTTVKWTSSQATVSGGKAYAINNESSAKNLISSSKSKYRFAITNNGTIHKFELDCAIQEGDVIKIDMVGGHEDGKGDIGIWVSTSETRPSSAPACAGSWASDEVKTDLINYTVTSTDEYHGKKVLYVHRSIGKSTYFSNVRVLRPYAITFSSAQGTAPSATTGFEATLTQITGVDGWNHTGWTANKAVKVGTTDYAAGNAIPVSGTAKLSDDTQFTAVWEEIISPAATPSISAHPATASYTWKQTIQALTVTATVTDGGTLHYQWYKEAGENDTKVGTDANSYTPEEAGTYYVVVTNKKTGYEDASATSNNAVITIGTRPSYTVTYFDGTSSIGTESVLEDANPAEYAAKQAKACHDFVNWKNNADVVIAPASLVVTKDTALYGNWTANYAFGAYSFVNTATVGTNPSKTVTGSKVTYETFRIDNFYFSGMDITYESGASTALNDYKGWKINTQNATIKFLVEKNSQVKVAIGRDNTAAVSYTALNGTAMNNVNQEKSTEVAYSVKAGTIFTISMTTGSTITLKRITITPLYNATYTDGTGDASGSASNVTEVTLPTPSETTVGSYSFTGWVADKTVYDDEENAKTAGEALSAGGTYTLTATTTFTAQWQLISDFDVKFYQGYGEPDAQIGETQGISTGGHAVAPTDPTRTGFAFLGWSYDATEAHIVEVATYAITAATNFTAMWKAVWTVTFDGAGSVEVENGEKVASPDSPTQAGKVFQGWYNGESKYDFSAAVASNLALTSKWADADPNHYVYAYNDDFHFDDVVYKTPDGKTKDPEADEASNVALATNPYTLFSGASGITSIVATNGIYDYKKGAGTKHITAYLKLKADDATSNVVFTIASGYTAVLKLKMNGYSSNATISLKKGDDAVTPSGTQEGTAEGKNYGELTYNLAAGEYKLTTANKTLYISHIDLEATAIPAKTVIYHANNGTSDQTEDNNATEIATCSFSYTGHKFIGWNESADGTGMAHAVGAVVGEDLELYAQWVEVFAVTFNMNGQSGSIDAQSVEKNGTATKPADPVVVGQEFGGWYTSSACADGDEFDFSTAITEAKELFAKWTAFDGCVMLYPATSGVSPANEGDEIAMQTGSEGATMTVNALGSGAFAYSASGLQFGGGGGLKADVTLNSNTLKAGSVISMTLIAQGTNTRGLYLNTAAGVRIDAFTCWVSGTNPATNGAEETFTYTVVADDGLDGTNAFQLERNNTVLLKKLTIKNCGAEPVTVTFKKADETLIEEKVLEKGSYVTAPAAPRICGSRLTGWSETVDGALVDLATTAINADKTFYPVYAVNTPVVSGTVYKFQLKTDLTSGNMFATAPLLATALTTENFLSELVGGELEASNTNNNNNRIVISDQKAIGFSNGDGGKLTLYLNEPLKVGDEIRFINYASSGNSITLSDGTNNTTLNGNGSETVQTFSVPAAWEETGSCVLTMVRGSNTAKLTYFEVYRRPVLTGVSLNELTVRVNAVANPEMTLTPSNDAIVTNQAWSIVSGSDKIDIDPATGAVTGVAAGDAVIKVVLNEDEVNFSATATVHVVNDYARQDVTGSMEWNWANSGPLNGVAAHENNNVSETLLANIGTMPNNADFRSDMLVTTCQHAYRSGTGNGCWQGTEIKFYTTVPGAVKVNYMGTGSSDAVTVSINDWSKTYNGNWTDSKTVVVPAGWVTISASVSNKLRIKTITFTAAADLNPAEALDEAYYYGGYTRDVNPQYYGTICLPKAGVIAGATLFELAYMDYKEDGVTPYKVYYDEVLNGELEAGMPYIFLAQQSIIGVFYTNTAEETAKDKNGLHGTLEDITSGMDGVNKYMLYNNQVLHSTSPASMLPANRAYIQLNEVEGYNNPNYHAAPAKQGRSRISTSFNAPQIATGMEDVQGSEVQTTKVLINGELYILRGEKMYDATGRLVK